MAEIFLIRHGQASFGTDNYDQLSAVGEQQARRLGEYFKERGLVFDTVVGGTMQRHRQTTEAIAKGLNTELKMRSHSGWNEYDHETLFQAYILEHPEDPEVNSRNIADYMGDRNLFYRILFRALPAWAEGKVGGAAESWGDFCARTQEAMNNLGDSLDKSGCRRALVSSSGGALSVALMLATKMPAAQGIDLMRQMKNTAINQMFFSANRQQRQWHLHSFNSLPHLDNLTNRNLITYG